MPALVGLVGLGQRRAHGTSLAAVVPIAAAGAVGYLRAGAVDLVAVLALLLGSAAGALLGSRLLDRLPEGPLRRAFGAFLLLVAVQLLVTVPSGGAEVAARGLGPTVALVAVGAVTGTAAGLLGIGGGVIVVPALVLLLGVSDVVAKGTSLALIVPTALIGTASNLRRGNADLEVAALVGVAGIATSFAAATLATGLDARVGVPLFAAFLVVVAARLLRRHPPPPAADVDQPTAS